MNAQHTLALTLSTVGMTVAVMALLMTATGPRRADGEMPVKPAIVGGFIAVSCFAAAIALSVM